jgi:hypothetical protein
MGVAAMQIGRICTIPDLARPDCASVQIGGDALVPMPHTTTRCNNGRRRRAKQARVPLL